MNMYNRGLVELFMEIVGVGVVVKGGGVAVAVNRECESFMQLVSWSR